MIPKSIRPAGGPHKTDPLNVIMTWVNMPSSDKSGGGHRWLPPFPSVVISDQILRCSSRDTSCRFCGLAIGKIDESPLRVKPPLWHADILMAQSTLATVMAARMGLFAGGFDRTG